MDCMSMCMASQAHVTDWLEAFAAHPKIGDLDSLKTKYTEFAKSSQTEQATAATASGDILQVSPAEANTVRHSVLLVLSTKFCLQCRS